MNSGTHVPRFHPQVCSWKSARPVLKTSISWGYVAHITKKGLRSWWKTSKNGASSVSLEPVHSNLLMIGATYQPFLSCESLLKIPLRVGTTVCKWLHNSLHDLHAISTFDYLLPLMVSILVLFRSQTFIRHLPSPKSFALLNVRSTVDDADQPYTNLSCSQR